MEEVGRKKRRSRVVGWLIGKRARRQFFGGARVRRFRRQRQKSSMDGRESK